MQSIKEILYRLVAEQSDTGTRQEVKMADTIYEMLMEDDYFRQHPQYCGKYLKEDALGRPVVWAMKPGKSKKTVILLGHYDAVELAPYGSLTAYALNPELLKQKMKETAIEDKQLKKDLDDDDWAFGRGMGDMKAGVAINLSFLLSDKAYDATLLFVSVPDEENLSSGAMQAVQLYQELQEQYDLEYTIALLGEPETKEKENISEIQVLEGSFGKIMPVVMTKGILSHVANIAQGLNSTFMLAEIVRNMEINPSFITHSLGQSTPLPTTLVMKDLKATYDVSTPQYSAACFNILFVDSKKPLAFLNDIRRITEQSMATVTQKYQQSFDKLVRLGNEQKDEMIDTSAKIVTITALEDLLQKKNEHFSNQKQQKIEQLKTAIQSGEWTLLEASLDYLKWLLTQYETTRPVVLIGFVPPYYPAVTNRKVEKDVESLLDGVAELTQASFGGTIKRASYMPNVCDISYLMNADPEGDRQFLQHLALTPDIYDVPVEKIAKLNIPVFMIGPTARNIHEVGERVFMPDVEHRIPLLIEKIIQNAAT
ncbi:M20/M25/M40 family metallo-hydrolase [Pisciglobus halotolerans]|uniref:Arginine utilization protein RocB n=1 Tax=Pisciglobus halotolerans TaxID=745365 RepID=A0A1I3AR65_9LACT|nr:M20/M25/M40 family metallo-hydrolase [Pisciglobus halotolerans]SFH52567.1 Arginine utilization protein RocB [Pisciglobus halotolerans]